MEVVKSMIHDQDLPMHLWDEVARTVVYVQNRISHNALGNKTLEEMFIGEKPKFIHLKIFGCLVYIPVPKKKISKLDPLGKKGIFVGYCDKSKFYRVCIPGYHQTEININVTFDEDTLSTNPEITMQSKIMKKSRRLL